MRNPLNSRDVNGNTMAWMKEQEFNSNRINLCRRCECVVEENEMLCEVCQELVDAT